jgi:hypothetical protein
MAKSLTSETKPKKMVNRNVAVALGIICIFLGAVLASSVTLLNNAILQNKNLQSYLDDIAYLDKSLVFTNNYSISIDGGGFWNQVVPTSNISGVLEIKVVPFNPNLWIEVNWMYASAMKYPPFSTSMQYSTKEYMENSKTAYYYPIVASSYDLGETDFYIGNNSTQTIAANVTVVYYY